MVSNKRKERVKKMDGAKILEAKEFAMRFIESVENYTEFLINLIKEDVHPDNMTDEMGRDGIERKKWKKRPIL